jgi:hypothetical protein
LHEEVVCTRYVPKHLGSKPHNEAKKKDKHYDKGKEDYAFNLFSNQASNLPTLNKPNHHK